MFSPSRITINYAIFAVIATVANIVAQDIFILSFKGTFATPFSIAFGTGVGLITKYILDKRYIFRFQTHSVSHNTKIFALYTVMGLTTTLIFWGFEFAFHHTFESKEMRYIGGVIGLMIGYRIKYQLDKHYVFDRRVL